MVICNLRIKIIAIVSALFMANVSVSFGQINSENGYWSTSTGTLRVFLVFAEILNDPNYNSFTAPGWSPGLMPENPDYLFDHVFNSSNIQGMVTKVYNEASFGEINVIGDYLNHLVQIDVTAQTSRSAESEIMNHLKNIPLTDITTKNAYSFNGTDFDVWQKNSSRGGLKSLTTDDYIDLIVVLFRVNTELSGTSDNSGFCVTSDLTETVKNKNGFQDRIYLTTFSSQGWSAVKHELAHSILGGSRFHTAGNPAGDRTFIAPTGGYSLLNYSNAMGDIYNGFDRYRLGWKHSSKTYQIGAIDATTNLEVNTDFIYDYDHEEYLYERELILRDFATYGDAVRIKLPYLKDASSGVSDQWLWLENHQLKSGNEDLRTTNAEGIYAYIQVGKNDFTQFFEGFAGYLYPLHALGNYDVELEQAGTTAFKSLFNEMEKPDEYLIEERADFSSTSSKEVAKENIMDYLHNSWMTESNFKSATGSSNVLVIDSEMQNPFTGYNISQGIAMNFVDPNVVEIAGTPTNIYDEIFSYEVSYPDAVKIDGQLAPSSNFGYGTYPSLGSTYDPFLPSMKIGIETNPSSTPVMTYRTRDNRPISSHNSADNRFILLNGLSIEVLELQTNGDVKIRIKWNDYDIDNDVRWCGPIVSNKQLTLKSGYTIELDQGLTPTRPIDPITFNGKKIFADPTIFTNKENSDFNMETSSYMQVINNSAFVSEANSTLEIQNGAILTVKEGSTFALKENASLVITGSGRIEIEDGAYICIEPGANITLQDPFSVINLHAGFTTGVNTSVLSGLSCISNPSSIVTIGDGDVNLYNQNIFIQNEVINTDRYITGSFISLGENVTPYEEQGEVIISAGNTVILDAENEVLMDKGFSIEPGASLEIK